MRGVVQHEMVGHFTRGDIDHFYAAVIVGRDENRLVVVRQADAGGQAGLHADVVDDLALGFIDYQHPIGIGAAEQRAGRGRDTRKGSTTRVSCFIVVLVRMHDSVYGNTRSRLRQSLVADAHLLAQSG